MPDIYSTQTSSGGGVQATRVTYTDGTGYYIHTGNTGTWFGTFVGPAPGPAATAAATGVNPTETSYSLYGHVIPLSLGKVRIGGEIIAGPWIENGLASFCISFGVPFDPGDTRTLTEIAFDSEVVWENGSFNTEPFTFRYYPGTLAQAADPLEISHYGADAVAYRPQMLLWFENLPLANTKFQKIPYVAAVIVDSTGGDVNLGSAFETLAYSPWVGFTSSDFETQGVTDGVTNGGMIITQDAEFLSFVQQFSRFYRNWNLLQTDKLRITDRGARVAPDITLDKSTLTQQVVFARAETNSVPRELELSTIDPDADYTIVVSKASSTREPVAVSASVRTESVYLPVVMDSSTRMSVATYTKYQEEIARKKVTGTAMTFGLQMEPGDLVALVGLGDGFEASTFKVIETLHGADYTVEFTAEAFMDCGFPGDPHWAAVVLLLGFEDADGAGAHGTVGVPTVGFTDESSRHHASATSPNNSQIDTAYRKFGLSSVWINGGGAELVLEVSYDWNLSASNSDQFTIECFARFDTIGTTPQCMVSSYRGGILTPPWYFAVHGPAAEIEFGFIPISSGVGGAEVVTSTAGANVQPDIWYHLAVDKDATGKIRVYVNGVMKGSSTPTDSSILGSPNANAWELLIGLSMDGWIDEMRITKGIARYHSDGGFPVPTSAYPRGGIL